MKSSDPQPLDQSDQSELINLNQEGKKDRVPQKVELQKLAIPLLKMGFSAVSVLAWWFICFSNIASGVADLAPLDEMIRNELKWPSRTW
ncbi:MAG: hypothetical protein MUF49_13440 [Oculatellaceae cyanobacterium Prado106]|jgi:hypothetical protein|nr:hypothetical protein [Oculatellaceae cyanobacterium Prado106]